MLPPPVKAVLFLVVSLLALSQAVSRSSYRTLQQHRKGLKRGLLPFDPSNCEQLCQSNFNSALSSKCAVRAWIGLVRLVLKRDPNASFRRKHATHQTLSTPQKRGRCAAFESQKLARCRNGCGKGLVSGI